LSDFEAARILATRADQISHSGVYFCSGKADNAAELARMELAERKIPLVLRRFRGEVIVNGRRETHVEDWDPNTMIFKHDY
jgi:DNA-directed RNA polymerase subunit K/omega